MSTNWAKSVEYQAASVASPQSAAEAAALIAAASTVKPLGTRHSFSWIADTKGVHLSAARMLSLGEIDEDGTVWVGAGHSYGSLCPWLEEKGFALPNLASLPHISVAGACATGTHGSGVRVPGLASAVCGIEIVSGKGEVEVHERGGSADFEGLVVNLGCMGLVTKIKFQLVPSFRVSQTVYDAVPLSLVTERYQDLAASAYSVSFFTPWDETDQTQVWCKDTGEGTHSDLLAGHPASGPRHPIPGMDPSACTEQMGVPGAWHNRLPHFRLDHTPSSGEELQSEYFVPRELASEAIEAIRALAPRFCRLVQISEIRTIAAEEQWMSPAFGRDSTAIHFTWKKDAESVAEVLPIIERALAPFGARPHWGKLFTLRAQQLEPLYPRWKDFLELRERKDPERKLMNRYLEEALGC